jgi:hypothetical protein
VSAHREWYEHDFSGNSVRLNSINDGPGRLCRGCDAILWGIPPNQLSEETADRITRGIPDEDPLWVEYALVGTALLVSLIAFVAEVV